MSRLKELMQTLCPNGVEYISISELCELRNGYTPSKARSEYWEGGTIPWFRMEDIRQNGRILSDSLQHITPQAVKGSKLFPANSIILATTATIGEHALITVDFLSNQRFTNLNIRESLTHRVNIKFFYYYMFIVDEWCKNNINISGFASVDMSKFKKLPIPVPPREVQEEIVRILDKFTELEAELEAELECRKRQYQHYRDSLLNFTPPHEEITKLKDVIMSLNTGLNPRKFFSLNTNDAKNYYVTIREIHNNRIVFSDKTDRIDDEALRLCNKRSKLEKDDVLFSGTGTIGEVAVIEETPTNWNIKEGVYTIKPKKEYIIPKFLMYMLSCTEIKNKYMKKAVGGTVRSIPMEELKNIQIPIPPIEEQRRIVEILDKFEALTTDLCHGLPAEIEARRKQYEHYRDQLLTFKRLTA